jgi:hypothetical protein
MAIFFYLFLFSTASSTAFHKTAISIRVIYPPVSFLVHMPPSYRPLCEMSSPYMRLVFVMLRSCHGHVSLYLMLLLYYTLPDTFNFRCLLFCFFSRLRFMFSFNSLPFTSPPHYSHYRSTALPLTFFYLGNTFFLSINRTINERVNCICQLVADKVPMRIGSRSILDHDLFVLPRECYQLERPFCAL